MVTANGIVALSVVETRLPPGAAVVSISTYVELSTCAMGVTLLEGVPEALFVADGVTERVALLERVTERVALLVGERVALWVGVTVGVSVCESDTGNSSRKRESASIAELLNSRTGEQHSPRSPVHRTCSKQRAVDNGKGTLDNGPSGTPT